MTEARGVLTELVVTTGRLLAERHSHLGDLLLVSHVTMPIVIKLLLVQNCLLVE